MHNRVPQMGFYHKGLGSYIYNEPQMGNALSDLWGSITGAASGVKPGNVVLTELEKIKADALKNFLETGTGQAAVEDAKKSWIEQQAANAKQTVVQYAAKAKANPMITIGAVLAIGAVVYVIANRKRGQSPTQALAAANPFGKRRKHSRKSRRIKRRRK